MSNASNNTDLNEEGGSQEQSSEVSVTAASETPTTVEAPEAASAQPTPTAKAPTGQGRQPFGQHQGQGRPNRSGPGGGGGGQRRGPGGGSGGGRGPSDRGPRGGGGPANAAEEAERSEWKEKVIQIRRVTKVVKGGKKLSFRAVVVVGNGKGEVGIGLGKSNEVIGAIQKAVAAAKKSLITVPLHQTTIPHAIKSKAGGSTVVLLPASKGTGVIAGGAARALLELSGIENILSKSLGSNSPLNVARATLKGLSELRTYDQIARARGKSVKEILV
jgi:small subunit ribosomal protein S5